MKHNSYSEYQPEVMILSGGMDVSDKGYEESMDTIRLELKNLKASFIRIGWHLKRIKDNGWYKREGYKNIYQFANEKFCISQPTATRLINICVEFSKGGDSPELDAEYRDYSLSQLTEMLNMCVEKRRDITPDMTVRKIREIKRKDGFNATSHIDDIAHTDDTDNKIETLNTVETFNTVKSVKSFETYIQPKLPIFENDSAHRNWLENVEDWGLWYVDERICAAYYKYDFPDGCKLVAVEYGYGRNHDVGERKFSYHMIFSDSYIKEHKESCRSLSNPGIFTDQTIEIDTLVEFLKEMQEKGSADADLVADGCGYVSNEYIINEFDPDDLEEENNKDKKYVTRQYVEFYKKKHYIPKFFNVKNKKEIIDYAPTLTTSSGSCAGLGAIIVFDARKEIKNIDEKLIRGDITWEEAEQIVGKIWRIAKPEELEMICQMRLGQADT